MKNYILLKIQTALESYLLADGRFASYIFSDAERICAGAAGGGDEYGKFGTSSQPVLEQPAEQSAGTSSEPAIGTVGSSTEPVNTAQPEVGEQNIAAPTGVGEQTKIAPPAPEVEPVKQLVPESQPLPVEESTAQLPYKKIRNFQLLFPSSESAPLF